jgi:hypothetical protein
MSNIGAKRPIGLGLSFTGAQEQFSKPFKLATASLTAAGRRSCNPKNCRPSRHARNHDLHRYSAYRELPDACENFRLAVINDFGRYRDFRFRVA